MIYLEKAPFLLTILFSALAWTASQVAGDAAMKPFLEYARATETVTTGKGQQTKHIFRLTNISSEKAFSNMYVKCRLKDGAGVSFVGEPEMSLLPPTELMDPDKAEEATPPEYIDNAAAFQIPMLQPGAVIHIAMYTDKAAPVDIYVWSKNPVKMVEASPQTYIIKNRFQVMIGLIVLWSALILLYFHRLNRHEKKRMEAEGAAS